MKMIWPLTSWSWLHLVISKMNPRWQVRDGASSVASWSWLWLIISEMHPRWQIRDCTSAIGSTSAWIWFHRTIIWFHGFLRIQGAGTGRCEVDWSRMVPRFLFCESNLRAQRVQKKVINVSASLASLMPAETMQGGPSHRKPSFCWRLVNYPNGWRANSLATLLPKGDNEISYVMVYKIQGYSVEQLSVSFLMKYFYQVEGGWESCQHKRSRCPTLHVIRNK